MQYCGNAWVEATDTFAYSDPAVHPGGHRGI